MKWFSQASQGRIYVCRFDYEADLLESIKRFVEEKNIGAAFFIVIGAVKKARLNYYNQEEKRYLEILVDKPLEIASCMGNIAKMDGKTIVHAHIVFSDKEGKTYGGHLASGTIIFAGEMVLVELKDIELRRKYDEVTGLNLFNL